MCLRSVWMHERRIIKTRERERAHNMKTCYNAQQLGHVQAVPCREMGTVRAFEKQDPPMLMIQRTLREEMRSRNAVFSARLPHIANQNPYFFTKTEHIRGRACHLLQCGRLIEEGLLHFHKRSEVLTVHAIRPTPP